MEADALAFAMQETGNGRHLFMFRMLSLRVHSLVVLCSTDFLRQVRARILTNDWRGYVTAAHKN